MSNLPPIPNENPYSASTGSLHAPPITSTRPVGEDATGGLIPYNNPMALIAYYLGLFSLFPCLGLVLAIPAFVLGILGLRARNRNPAIRGSVHAWIGIILGGIMMVIWLVVDVGLLIAIFSSNRNR